ncbi:MAG TPA: hypothetical protein VLV76_08130 [Candidatus Acidoferrum sp.]|nr:hypothetical protein [Candidatus Acidoferrum sp.]
MRTIQSARRLPNTRRLTIVAQDPSVKLRGRIATTEVEIPAEELAPGPCGYRVSVIDYDASTNVLYEKAEYPPSHAGGYGDPYRQTESGRRSRHKAADARLLSDPRFHAQNVYAIVMRTLARFEFALGRRVAWGSDGHQLHIAPHAFTDANAFYSREDRSIFFGYFFGSTGQPIFTCLSHDIVAHETTHAILDGLRRRYLEPSSPDQAAFHEGFADVVALLSVFSLREVVEAMLDLGAARGSKLIDERFLSREKLKDSVLLGLADEMGEELSKVRGQALRRSVELPPGKPYMSMPGFDEEHERGELIVAAMMNAFLDIWLARLDKIGTLGSGKKDRSLVVEQGALVADHLLTMAIRAIDYCPPTDLTFADYLSALLTIDHEVVPDDGKFGYRDALLRNFKAYDIEPARGTDEKGVWKRFDQPMVHSRSHFDSLLRDKEEVFRFIWENRTALQIHKDGYVEVQSVRPSIRIGPDGFVLREAVAEYVEILTLTAGELPAALGITPPPGIPKWRRIRIFGGGALIFDEYGQLKYQISNRIQDVARQEARLKYLAKVGFFDQPPPPPPPPQSQSRFALVHLSRATS